jgi:hypothetical protein
MKRILGCLALVLASSANATIITSTKDPALAGARFQNFDNVAPGTYASLALPGVTIVGRGGSMSISNANGSFGRGGLNLSNPSGTPASFDLVFSAPVTAFGIYGGAVNSSWVYTAFDSTNKLLESITTAGACCSPMFYGIANKAGIARVTLQGAFDWVIFDDLYIGADAPSSVPEPASITLFGAALAGLAGVRRKNKAVRAS